MAIPGIPSGENHSWLSQQCGRNRIPFSSSSRYRRWMAGSRSVPWMASFKSQNRRLSNWSSESVSHAWPAPLRAPAALIRVCPPLREAGTVTRKSYLQTALQGRGALVLTISGVTIETVTTLDGVAALRPCYERLHRASGNILPFALHEWHLTWCRHFLNCNPGIRDEPLFYVLRDSAGACVAILPFILSRRRFGPLKVVSINMLGADPGITEISAPLIAPGYEHLTAHAVQDQLAKVGGWDCIHWTGISEAFAAALNAGSL